MHYLEAIQGLVANGPSFSVVQGGHFTKYMVGQLKSVV